MKTNTLKKLIFIFIGIIIILCLLFWIRYKTLYRMDIPEEEVLELDIQGHYGSVSYAYPKNVSKERVVVSIKDIKGNEIRYTAFQQNKQGVKYLAHYGCSTCALTTICRALADDMAGATPAKMIESYRWVLGKGYKNKALNLNGCATYLNKKGIKAKHYYNFDKDIAEKQIKIHLLKGKPVIFTAKKDKLKPSICRTFHTMVLVAMHDDKNAILLDSSVHGDKAWGSKNMRVKIVPLDHIVSTMWSSDQEPNSFYWNGKETCGGYILIN